MLPRRIRVHCLPWEKGDLLFSPFLFQNFNLFFDNALIVHTYLAMLYSEMDLINEAEAEAQKILKLVPNFSVETWGERIPYKDPAQAERDMASLRKAGLK